MSLAEEKVFQQASVEDEGAEQCSLTVECLKAEDTNENALEDRFINVEVLKEEFEDDNVDLQVRLLEDSENGSILLLSEIDQGQIIDRSNITEIEETLESSHKQVEESLTEEDQTSEEIYSCNSCGISFTSVLEHIQNFHNDQEVVVEMADDEGSIETTLGDVTLLQVLPNEECEEVEGVAELEGVTELEAVTEIEDDNQEIVTIASEEKRILLENGQIVTAKQVTDSPTQERWRQPHILNTLREEQCVDLNGRLYTRKVVQIEKFWDENDTKVKVQNDSQEDIGNDDNKGIEVSDISSQEYLEEGVRVEEGEAGSEPVISRVYHCARCFTNYLTLELFEAHVCKPAQGKYKCDHCHVTYRNSKSLCAHMKVHKSLKKKWTNPRIEPNTLGPYRCNVCDTIFPTNKSLRLHVRMHEPVRQRPIEAPVEYPGTPTADGSSADDTDPLANNSDRFHCTLCDKWIHVGYKKIHDSVHTGQIEYNCDICNRKFFTEENLHMHLSVHTTEKISNVRLERPLPYECNYCSRQFARPHEKVKHERIHTGEKPHSCDICGKSFRVSYCLTLHMRTHTGARPYVCLHCGKRFKAHSVYNHHVLTHSNVRAYKCPFCPKAFKTSVQLAGHKNSHTKPFSCTECNRPFASLYAVRVHMETHKRQNNLKFNCQLCGASYARAFALRDHLKAQHNTVQEDFSVPEVNAAALSILPRNEESVQMVDLVMHSDGEMEECAL